MKSCVSSHLHSLKVAPFERNVAFLKSYAGQAYKLTRCNCVRTKGVELPKGIYVEKGTVNDEKLSSNISRALSTIRELVLCNPFDLFATLTLDKTKFDRYQLKAFNKALSQWIRNYNKKYGIHIKFLLIPETHKDGAWHMHGFLMGLPLELLEPFTLDMKLPNYIRDKLIEGETIYNWPEYAAKFGFVDIEPVRSRERAASYVTKYITKDLARSVSELGAHVYYASKGLARATLLKRGTAVVEDLRPDFANEYCEVNWFDRSIPQSVLESMVLTDKEKERLRHDATSSSRGLPD